MTETKKTTGQKVKKLTLAQKILQVSQKVAYLQKTETGEKGHYKYVPASAVNAAVLPALHGVGIILVPRMLEQNGEFYDEQTKNGTRTMYLSRARMEYVFMDTESEESLVVPWSARASHSDPAKAGGSALTYYGRYFLMNFFGIATDELDPDRWDEKTVEKKKINADDWAGYKVAVEALAPEGDQAARMMLWKGARAYITAAFRVQATSDLLQFQVERVEEMIAENPAFMAEKFRKLGMPEEEPEGGSDDK